MIDALLLSRSTASLPARWAEALAETAEEAAELRARVNEDRLEAAVWAKLSRRGG